MTPTINNTTHTYTINKTVNSAMGIDDFSYQKDYEFLVIATDKLKVVPTQETVVRGIGILELYSDTALVNGNLEVTKDTNLIGKLKKNGNDFVVNNLTTKDAERALSANQGNVLGNQINTLNEKINKLSSYSTEEKVVGTWVDGRPLYEKTVIGNGVLYAGATLLSHNVSNIGETRFFVSAYYRFINGGTNNGYYTGQWVNSTSYVTVQHITSTGIEIQCGTNWAQLFIPHVTIRYTKTTDAATTDVALTDVTKSI